MNDLDGTANETPELKPVQQHSKTYRWLFYLALIGLVISLVFDLGTFAYSLVTTGSSTWIPEPGFWTIATRIKSQLFSFSCWVYIVIGVDIIIQYMTGNIVLQSTLDSQQPGKLIEVKNTDTPETPQPLPHPISRGFEQSEPAEDYGYKIVDKENGIISGKIARNILANLKGLRVGSQKYPEGIGTVQKYEPTTGEILIILDEDKAKEIIGDILAWEWSKVSPIGFHVGERVNGTTGTLKVNDVPDQVTA